MGTQCDGAFREGDFQVSILGMGSLEWSLYIKVSSMLKSGGSWSLWTSICEETILSVEKNRLQTVQRYMRAPECVFRWQIMVERPRKKAQAYFALVGFSRPCGCGGGR